MTTAAVVATSRLHGGEDGGGAGDHSKREPRMGAGPRVVTAVVLSRKNALSRAKQFASRSDSCRSGLCECPGDDMWSDKWLRIKEALVDASPWLANALTHRVDSVRRPGSICP